MDITVLIYNSVSFILKKFKYYSITTLIDYSRKNNPISYLILLYGGVKNANQTE